MRGEKEMILSVSRRTDIPRYYGQWFRNRIREGYLLVRNPVNPRQISQIDLSPSVVDCMVFWTKNPAGLIPYLDELEKYPYYFQFTLTGYGHDVEPDDVVTVRKMRSLKEMQMNFDCILSVKKI